jgi:hypothetical protein
MGLFDGIFNNQPAEDAAAAQTAGLQAGNKAATAAINTGQATTNTDYAGALAPINTNLQTTQGGQKLYADALGVNGQPGYDAAVQAFHASPGYQFSLDQGSQNLMRNANQTGNLASGGTDIDLQKLGIGTADQEFQKWLSNLNPFIGASTANAATGATTDISKASTDTDFAKTLANLGWSTATGIGNANANADLNQSNISGNALNVGMQGLKFAAGLLPFL